MNEVQDARAWAQGEFRETPRLEKRCRSRLITTAAQLAQRPDGTWPQRLTRAQLRGAYRLIHNTDSTPDTIQAGHRQCTRVRMDRDGVVLIVHDGTEHDFTGHDAVAAQLGTTSNGHCRGFIQHNSLAVDPGRGELLGLIYQQTFARQEAPPNETRTQRQQRVARESAVWAAGIRAVGPMPANRCWVHVGDRGADFFEAMATARLNASHFLIRLYQDRCVRRLGAPDDGHEHLLGVVRALPAQITDVVAVASKGSRPARQARVCLASTRVLMAPPVHDAKWRGHSHIAATLVRIWEPEPPEGVEGLEWILGTDLLVHQPKDLLVYRDWYQWRWRTAEEYHKVQKSGCRIEQIRFETTDRLRVAMALISVVAIRVLSLRWQRDVAPQAPAQSIASATEIRVVQKLTGSEPPITTVVQFVDAVARLGGYLGRKHDGPPGWQTLWRGAQRLADILLGVELTGPAQDPQDKLPKLNRSG
jgi:hypothetical protein